MTSKLGAVSLAAASAAAFVVFAVMAWLFTREGSVGLYRWTTWRGRFNAILIAGALPLALALLGLALRKVAGGGLGAALGLAATALAGIVALGAIGFLAWLLATSRAMSAPAPKVRLVDPVSGIASSAEGKVSLSFSSDPHWGVGTADAAAREAILRGVAARRPDAFLVLGDHVEEGQIEGPWREAAGAYASLLGEVPVRPLMGNHDAVVNGQYHYERFFFPDRAMSDTGSPLYYSIDSGPVRIFVLDILWRAESFGREQARWLESSLAALPPGKQAIVVSHCFAYSSGYVDEDTGLPWYDSPEVISRLGPILERGRVALHVAGHNHYLELLEARGVTYAVVGAMGGKPDPEPTYVSPASRWIAVGTYGRLDVEASASGLELSFVDASGAVLKRAFVKATR